MKGKLYKTESGWVVRYKVPAYTKASEQTFFDRELPLHPDEPHIVDSRWDGEDVEFEEVEFVCEQRGDNVWVRYGAKNINQLPQQETSAKQEAEDLLHKYRMLFMNEGEDYGEEILVSMLSMKCALIAVNKLLEYSKAHGFVGLTEHYEQVKQEIDKL
jgi:hypothetical protein